MVLINGKCPNFLDARVKINYSRSAIFHILMRKFRFKIYHLMGPCTTGSMSYKLYSTQLNKTLNQPPAQFMLHLGKSGEEISGILILVHCVLTEQVQWQQIGRNCERHVLKDLCILTSFKKAHRVKERNSLPM